MKQSSDADASPPIPPELFAMALEISPASALVISATTGDVVWANRVARGRLDDPQRGISLRGLIPLPSPATIDRSLARLNEGERLEWDVDTSDGAQFTVFRVASFFVAVEQATIEPAATELVRITETDPLTGLPHRTALEQFAKVAIARKSVDWGLLFIDLDNYKQVNDELGHLHGDRVLIEFTRKLRGCARPTDLVFRFGGDEFIVLVDHVASYHDLSRIADRIRDDVVVEVQTIKPIHVTASVGCAMAWPELQHPEEIIDRADRDMYRRKNAEKPHSM